MGAEAVRAGVDVLEASTAVHGIAKKVSFHGTLPEGGAFGLHLLTAVSLGAATELRHARTKQIDQMIVQHEGDWA